MKYLLILIFTFSILNIICKRTNINLKYINNLHSREVPLEKCYLDNDKCYEEQPDNTYYDENKYTLLETCVYYKICKETEKLFKDKCFKRCPKGTSDKFKIENLCIDDNYKDCLRDKKCYNDCLDKLATYKRFQIFNLKDLICEGKFYYQNKCVDKCPFGTIVKDGVCRHFYILKYPPLTNKYPTKNKKK